MFVQVMRGPVGDEAAVDAALDRWETSSSGVSGFLGSTSGLTTDGQVVVIARFESGPRDQDPGWSQMEQALAGPPVFSESAAVDVSMGGGSDEAGFVQVFWGKGDREAARSAIVGAEPVLRRERPDILGGFTMWLDDGRFIDVAYFRSEREAREGEEKELSEEGRAVFEEFGRVLAAEGYADIPEPRLR